MDTFLIFLHQDGNKTTICEVETADSINDASTIQQWKAFARSPYIFEVAVPESALESAKKMARDNGIAVNTFWYTKGY